MKLSELEHALVRGFDPLAESGTDSALREQFRPAGKLSVSESLDVYRNNVTSARVRALEAIFPVCQSVLGKDCFRALARDFSWAADDARADLNVYGKQFPAFLSAQQGDAYDALPYLEELARLEWLWHASYYAADADPFPFAEFAEASAHTDQITFVLADGLALLKTNYPVREIWRRHQAKESTESVAGLSEPECLCVCRSGHEQQVIQIEQATYTALENIQAGCSLDRLAQMDELRDVLAGLLPDLIGRGWICGFRMPDVRGAD